MTPTARLASLLGFSLLAACTPTHLLEATTTFSQSVDDATVGIGAAPDILIGLCHDTATADYLEATFESPQKDFDVFYASVERGGSTWRQHCDAYRNSNLVFALYVRVLGDYATALGAFAGDQSDIGPALGQSVGTLGKDVASHLPSFPLASGLASAGDAVGRIATSAETYWKAKHLGHVVTDRDADVATVVASLDTYLTNVRKTELADAESQLQTFTIIVAKHPEVPRLIGALVQLQLLTRLREAGRRLDALHDLLQDVVAAHHDLADGWKRGECAGGDTKTRAKRLARRMKIDFARLMLPVLGADG